MWTDKDVCGEKAVTRFSWGGLSVIYGCCEECSKDLVETLEKMGMDYTSEALPPDTEITCRHSTEKAEI